MLGAVSGAFLAPVIGWRGLFLVGLAPAAAGADDPLLGAQVAALAAPHGPDGGGPEIARLGASGRPAEIEFPTEIPDDVKDVPWRELFRYPRSVAASCPTAISQTGGVGLLLWITALFVLVLRIDAGRGLVPDDLCEPRRHRRPPGLSGTCRMQWAAGGGTKSDMAVR